jgi:sulfatase maturation enzyme AslB (radical SAM superfamily)
MNSTYLGEISKNSIDEAWNGEVMQGIRRLVGEGRYEQAGCKPGCPLLCGIADGQTIDIPLPAWIKAAAQNQKFKTNLSLFINNVLNKKSLTTNFPIELDIQPTEACNMKCIMCGQQHNNQDKIPPRLINKLFTHKDSLCSVRFQGGEIFLDPPFADFLADLKSHFLPYQSIVAITNASRLSFRQLDMMTSGSNPVHFIISMDATDEKTYKSIRRSKYFNTVKANMTYLSKIQQRKKIQDIVRWNFVIMRSNFHQVESAIKMAAELDITISFPSIIGSFKDENIFQYPALRNKDALPYIQKCLKTAQSLKVKAVNLKTIAQKLNR